MPDQPSTTPVEGPVTLYRCRVHGLLTAIAVNFDKTPSCRCSGGMCGRFVEPVEYVPRSLASELAGALERLVALATAGDPFADAEAISDGVWEALHREGLVKTTRDQTDEYETYVTAQGRETFERELEAALNRAREAERRNRRTAL